MQQVAAPIARRSRWGDVDNKIYIPGVPPLLPNTLSPLEFKALLYRIRIEEITHKLTTNNLDIDYSENRSPSPPFQYDTMGKRTNTREQRTKDKLLRERQDLILKAQKMNPTFRPPSDYRPMSTKKYKKIFIPVEKFPEYNFIGLIIGPRGLTQKQMEKESNAKIAIRGKGSMKDGKGRMNGKVNPGDDEPLHVLITADTEESIAKAEAIIKKLLIPIEEGKNEHKRQQLETLARINGTLRDNTWKGTEDDGFGDTGGSPRISCSICGEVSHPTRDCPMKGQPGTAAASRLDDEVHEFLSEIGGEGVKPNYSKSNGYTEEELDTEAHRQALDELMFIITGKPFSQAQPAAIPTFDYTAMQYGNWEDPNAALAQPWDAAAAATAPIGVSPYGPPPGAAPRFAPPGFSPYGPAPGWQPPSFTY